MKQPGPQMWSVQIRRVATCTVHVQHPDPTFARTLALELVDDGDFDEAEQAVAYETPAKFDGRYWQGDRTGGWMYPQQTLAGGDNGIA